MNKLALIGAFILGAAAGATGMYFYMEKSFNKKLDCKVNEEVIEIKERYNEKLNEYRKRFGELSDITDKIAEEVAKDREYDKLQREKAKQNQNKPDLMSYYKEVEKQGYTNYGKDDPHLYDEVLDPNREEKILDEAYVIKPEIFRDGVYDGFENVCLTYYKDGVLAYDGDDRIVDEEDAERIAPEDFADSFGAYDEEDIVYTRNDYTKLQYEIIRSDQTYREVVGDTPHDVEIK